ncbi:MAG: NINE protein [Saprospiraceae bacterium]|nr:NINE protein [Saprospiraceae bacterium]
MKDKNVAGILALFFGWVGVHRFYLGQVGLGIIYACLFWTGISAVLGLIDAIVFFSMDKDAFDAKYNRKYYRLERKRDTDFDRRDYGYREERRRRRRSRRKKPDQRYERPKPKPHNPYKSSGIKKYKDYEYDEAIKDFEKALEINPKDVAVHFNLACAYSLNEKPEKAFYHLDRAVDYGFDDFKRIKEHDALAYLRIQDQFEEFEKNGFRLVPKLEPPEEESLDLESSDLLERLKKLGELREKGLLTEEEFSAQKKKLLG